MPIQESTEAYVGTELQCRWERLEQFFAGSEIWQDIVRVIDESIEAGIDDLSDIELTGDFLQFSRGRLDQLRKFRALGDIMISSAKEQQNAPEEEEEENVE